MLTHSTSSTVNWWAHARTRHLTRSERGTASSDSQNSTSGRRSASTGVRRRGSWPHRGTARQSVETRTWTLADTDESSVPRMEDGCSDWSGLFGLLAEPMVLRCMRSPQVTGSHVGTPERVWEAGGPSAQHAGRDADRVLRGRSPSRPTILTPSSCSTASLICRFYIIHCFVIVLAADGIGREIRDWGWKSGRQPNEDVDPKRVAVDETVR